MSNPNLSLLSGTMSSIHSLCNRVLTKTEEMSSKLDLVLQNQGKMKRALLPHEKKVTRPPNMPSLPLSTVEAFKAYEKFLADKENFSAVVSFFISRPS